MSLDALVPILQVAIGPVILISGVGLLLLSMTNRFGRIIDRARQLTVYLRAGDGAERELARSQLSILATRAAIVRRAIALATLSLLFAAILIVTIFFAAIFALEVGIVVALLFIGCMASLVASLAAFLHDINLSLAAFRLEMRGAAEPATKEGNR